MIAVQRNKEMDIFNYYNFNYLINKFEKEINKHLKNKQMIVVCILKINQLKYYNYMFGYEFGDKIIKFVLTEITQQVNKYGHVYRFCGSKILIILHMIDNEKKAIRIIENIKTFFNNSVQIDKQMLRIIINIGMAIYPDDAAEANTILKYAQIALDAAKNPFTSKYKFFKTDMYKDIINKRKFLIDILNSINNKEFVLYYQPQINIKTKKLYGMEALIRWNHPKKGILPPIYFIDIVERNGMINEIGKFVFEKACCQLKAWNNLGYKNLTMSINVSHKQLEDESFLDFVKQVLVRTKINPGSIIIEITERVFLKPTDKILTVIKEIVNTGIKIFIDDFGTKYAVLDYLYKMPVCGIKIDKSFIDRIQESEKELIITKHIVNMAKEINLDVVAEGVENEQQLEWLNNINCYKIQGYIFGKPVNADDFIKYFEKYST